MHTVGICVGLNCLAVADMHQGTLHIEPIIPVAPGTYNRAYLSKYRISQYLSQSAIMRTAAASGAFTLVIEQPVERAQTGVTSSSYKQSFFYKKSYYNNMTRSDYMDAEDATLHKLFEALTAALREAYPNTPISLQTPDAVNDMCLQLSATGRDVDAEVGLSPGRYAALRKGYREEISAYLKQQEAPCAEQFEGMKADYQNDVAKAALLCLGVAQQQGQLQAQQQGQQKHIARQPEGSTQSITLSV